ncbi:hypothetical protein O0I10_009403 [Lichtheimia ornata]|uniref:F-box domain-containing protein n=1 Tax=Lichtheimia ornata TaxID=688661 RepID=A0AAD7UYG7_9FUNG|nr:uncharacterized protein O0I10_009403 [Lichtheimia ornata]KAJ8655007.1 hypothetical protein O0I10_009403 [Lichtheimia ornata]
MEALPSELITDIARWLTQGERYACIQVSKQWRVLFMAHLYRSVHIRDRQAMYLFLKAIRQTASDQLLGHYVREIVLGRGSRPLRPYRANELRDKTYRLGLSWPRWQALVRLCPNVELLDFHWTTWLELDEGGGQQRDHVLFPWRRLRGVAPFHNSGIFWQVLEQHGSRLTRLELTRAVLEHTIDAWQPILAQTPVLEELVLTSGISFGTLMTGPMLLYIDDLLEACPLSLKSLSLSMFKLDIRPQQHNNNNNNNHHPYRHLTRLCSIDMYTVEFVTPHPLDYMAKACTHLDKLAIGRSVMSFDAEYSKETFMDALVRVFAANRQSLRKVSMDSSWSSSWVLAMLQVLERHSLLELCIGSHHGRLLDSSSVRWSPDNYDAVLSVLSSRASTFEISLNPQHTIDLGHQLALPLQRTCPFLFELELNGAQQEIPLDIILQYLPSLHRLKLCNARVTIHHQQNCISASSTRRSRLQHCGLHLAFVQKDIFNCLATMCPSLTSLSLSACHFHTTLPSVSLDIDMPQHTLRHVSIQSMSAVCELPDTTTRERIHTLGMGKCLALGVSASSQKDETIRFYHVSYYRHSFTRELLSLPRDAFPYLSRESIPHHGSQNDLEALQKDWFKAHRQQRANTMGSSVPEKSFGYIALHAHYVHKCTFEDTLVPFSPPIQ